MSTASEETVLQRATVLPTHLLAGDENYLARAGFIVVSPEHPGDNRNDGSLSNTEAAAANRPHQASLANDSALSDVFLGSAADDRRICVLGHSMGGYKAFAQSAFPTQVAKASISTCRTFWGKATR